MRISIHAPRGGSDQINPHTTANILHFNPRSPWGERLVEWFNAQASSLFQSTLPVGGATWRCQPREARVKQFQSTLPVGGATYQTQQGFSSLAISIHAPRGGSDVHDGSSWLAKKQFQSTLPVGGATAFPPFLAMFASYFNPRSPWGERGLK